MVVKLDNTIIAVFGAIAATPTAVFCLGWWLSGQFRKVETTAREAAEKVELKTQQVIEHHEEIDQERHKENVENITQIKLILARNGMNGKHKT